MANFGELPFQKFKNSIFILLLLLVARCYLLYNTSLLSLLLTLLALLTLYISVWIPRLFFYALLQANLIPFHYLTSIMQPTVVLSILLLLSLVQKQSAIHVLNTTAYSAFYATSCTRSSPSDVYPVSCNPFNTSSLWLPSTIVYNGTVNISSDSLLTFVVSTLPSPLFFALSSLLIVVLLHLYPLNISFKVLFSFVFVSYCTFFVILLILKIDTRGNYNNSWYCDALRLSELVDRRQPHCFS